jgi:hypothetical protein
MVVGAVAVLESLYSYVLAIVFGPMISATVGGPHSSFTWLTNPRTLPVVAQQSRQLVVDDFVAAAQLQVQRGCTEGGISTVLLHQHDNGGPPSGEDGEEAEKGQQFHDDLFLVRRCNVDFGWKRDFFVSNFSGFEVNLASARQPIYVLTGLRHQGHCFNILPKLFDQYCPPFTNLSTKTTNWDWDSN